MPNHITNIVTIQCDSQELKDKIILSMVDSLGRFEFSRVIKMPEILKGTSSPNNENQAECIKATGFPDWYEWSRANWGTKWNAYEHTFPYAFVSFKPWHRTRKALHFLGKHKTRFYPERINKKRFKRSIKDNGVMASVEFQTAWNMPLPVFLSLSRKFPEVIVWVNWADEDLGSNCGVIALQNGGILEAQSKVAPDYSKQTDEEKKYWLEFAFKLCHPSCTPREWGINDKWEHED